MQEHEIITEDEAIDLAYKQIHYYSNIPRHIKACTSDLVFSSTSNSDYSYADPTFLPEGSTITVMDGKLNMPKISVAT